MDRDEKERIEQEQKEQDERERNKKEFELHLNYIDFLRQKSLKFVELRYQLALAINATIVGMWGFIGVIFSSTLLHEKPFMINLIIFLGIILTISLLTYWRYQVYEMYREEFNIQLTEVGHEIESIRSLFTPAIHGMNESFKKIQGKGAIDVYQDVIHLSIKDRYDFFNVFGLKLTAPSFYVPDIACFVINYFLLFIGLFFPLWLLPLISDYDFFTSPPFYGNWNTMIFLILTGFSVGSIIIINRLVESTRLYDPEDIEKMRDFIKKKESAHKH